MSGAGPEQRPLRLFVVAGEASGDNLAASIITALRQRLHPRAVDLDGVGGPALQRLGLVPRFPQTDIQLMGGAEAIADCSCAHLADRGCDRRFRARSVADR
jgi:lipid A disaccharide synthetase